MERIAFFIPYFGHFNSYFTLWLKTCSYQNDIADFYLFTDIRYNGEFPENVKLITISFEELKQKIQSKFDFKIELSSPYKFCDFKPAYGDIFRKYAEGYSHWAFGDNDLLWGDWKSMLPYNWRDCERLGKFGHLTIIKNTDRLRILYKYRNAYKIAFSSPYNCFFDECAFNTICEQNHVDIVPLPIADCNPRKRKIHLLDKSKDHSSGIFCYEDGHLYQLFRNGDKFAKEEFLYIHFLKRKMHFMCTSDSADTFFIYDHTIFSQKSLSVQEFDAYSKELFYWSYWLKFLYPKTLIHSLSYRMNYQRKRVLREIAGIID